MSNTSPVFIGGLYKSGTSLLRAMLGRHSNIASGLETFWFDLDFTGQAQHIKESRNWDATRNEPLEQHIDRLAAFFDLNRELVYSMCEQSSCAEEFLNRFMSTYASQKGKKRWVEKTPANVLHIDRIFSFWPNACFIHVVRDPRDVYSSNAKKSEQWSCPETFARLWIKFVSAYEKAKVSGRYPLTLEIRYEDIVMAPFKTMRMVLEYINEPWEESTACFSGEPQDIEKVRKITGKTSATLKSLSKPLAKDRIGAWRRELEKSSHLSELEHKIQQAGYGNTWNQYKYT